ncbi:hypothetical protein DSM106972_088930 [Dulcicalothrix desertica PCC 7102]|uniref:Uncharacterized protein n=1 Tax=Dulcicalothrix desertica PCC 7102 TaxID=232991 RepID=A0A3S1C5V5_9CYAN|nr:HEAT repeat domain-containing protein [Dulcicalothrix desertica]RUS95880.1 hypothetical protein DSM106972_088930 [Dulcicalothrix desertica PCC 7102]TWH39517.1 hypothetical protein CAL7102_08758 [Dulcicalothrix desertica PCC 7102]
MADNQPRDFDVVLGGEAPPPVAGVVLGGFEGVKNRLGSSNVDVRVAALSDALNYGEAGLDLLIGALYNDSSQQLKHLVGRLLKQKGGTKARQALLNYDPWLFFTKLEDWKIENFNPQIGIINPTGTAYTVNFEHLKLLLQNSHVEKVEALVCQIHGFYNNYDVEFYKFVNLIYDNRDKLHNLKALFIGDALAHPFMSSFLELGDITPILKAFPKLEVLQFRGGWGLSTRQLRHENLKTLVVETGLMFVDSDTVEQICKLDLPALEYLELWLGGCHHKSNEDISTKYLLPILAGKVFPNLSYLGLRSSDYSDNIAQCLAELPTVITRLAVLDLSMGTLTDNGVEALLNFAPINQLHTLDVSMNNLSISMIEKLSQLNCKVIAEPQQDEEAESGSRYCALYE